MFELTVTRSKIKGEGGGWQGREMKSVMSSCCSQEAKGCGSSREM